MYSLGIDLGTNSVKSLLLNLENGDILGIAQNGYGYITGTSAEQDVNYVFKMVVESIKKVILESKINTSLIKCIGLSGQMHGTVLYNRSGECISNIITWEDDRCSKDFLDKIAKIVGDEINKSGCGIATGYLGPTLYHIIKSSNIEISHALLPTDWLRQLLTGENSFKTDHSNGSSTGFFDTQNRDWNFSLIRKLGIDQDIFPKVKPTLEIDGVISSQIANITGLSAGTPVIIGGGDQPLSMIGSGICDPSDGFLINIGTGSQVSRVGDKYIKKENTIAFCFPEKGYSLLGAGLSGGASLNWWRNVSEGYIKMLGATLPKTNVFKEMSSIASKIPAGSDGLAFIPYLSGTRVNPNLTASFIGLKRHHGYAHLTRAIMEGVMFELYNFYERLSDTSDNYSIIGAGGGFSSELWTQIASDIFNKEIKLTICQEQASLGAALLAGVGTGYYKSIKEACSMVRYKPETAKPNKENVKKYREIYENVYLPKFAL
ncbi:MAG: xylulokinase [Candidatus Poribacteria bacterium]